jgi:myo-inositol-1(or 4)-monophosphatase
MIFSDTDIADLDALLRGVGEVEILPRFHQLEDVEIRQKQSALDLVTEADTAAEKSIAAALLQKYPSAKIVGEEAVADDPSILDGLAEAELAFVIDPVDGTYNFSSAMPLFGCMLAVVANGECVAGIIHYPVGQESLMAVSGGGSRLVDRKGVERQVSVAEPVPLDEMIGTISWGFMDEPLRSRVAGNLSKIAMTFALRCSAWEYRMAATGKVHFVGGQRLMPWDHLAGVLIHAEAGGYSALLDGSPYRPGITGGGLITATDRDAWEMIRAGIVGL